MPFSQNLLPKVLYDPVRVEPDGVLPPGDVDPDDPHAVPGVEGDDEVAVLRAHC